MFFKSTGSLSISSLALATIFSSAAFSAPDPNFHIYIAFGQSNMEGQATDFQQVDRIAHPRFKILASTNCPNLSRTLGEWASAVPPLFHCSTGLSPADYFGRTMADSLPDVTVGVIPVAVAGTSIKLFDKAQYASYITQQESWMQQKAADYGGNPYGRIIDLAKEAKKVGVIKGILMHQGETDAYSNDWALTVKKVYNDMLSDLELSADTVPFIAGEVMSPGQCASANNQIDALPKTIPTAYVVSSAGCEGGPDNLHFSRNGYVELGKRFAQVMLQHLNYSSSPRPEPTPSKPFKDLSIPGKIEAEDYDLGGAGVGFKDSDPENATSFYREDNAGLDTAAGGGIVYGYVSAGDWLNYTVNVKEDGKMNYTIRLASASTNASFSLTLDGEEIALIEVPNTGDWQKFEEISGTTKAVSKGTHSLRLVVGTPYFNVDWINFESEATSAIKGSRLKLSEEEVRYGVFTLSGKSLGSFTARADNFKTAWDNARASLPPGAYLLKNMTTGHHSRISNIKR